ncbi:MAG: hypothetical protein JSU00_14255 [Acidobacteria bacterium]|nr:hypothetical protein [Acidobacteriota bacterium]
MCRGNTTGRLIAALAAAVLAWPALAQTPKPDWRKIGNAALDLSLPAVATGPIERIWYSEDGERLYARAAADRTFVTRDMEAWAPVPRELAGPLPAVDAVAAVLPEAGARVRGIRTIPTRAYAIGRFVYRSDDGGAHWASLTNFKGVSILGDGLRDLAVSPRDADEIVVATVSGVWRSLDGGQSWTGMNQDLPNLPVWRILGTPANGRGLRLSVRVLESSGAFEWQPGEKLAWRPVQDADFDRDRQLRTAWTATLGATITAVASSGDYDYAGSSDGRLWVSADRGRSWTQGPDQFAAPVEAIFVDSRNPHLALAALGGRFASAPATARAPHLLRTINAGGFWDDLTANLPDVPAYGVVADRATGAVYVAGERGVFMAFEDLAGAGSPAQWSSLADGLPSARATDVRLDAAGNQLYAAFEGYGVYGASAPHRVRSPRLVSAADLSDRAAAPGALLTVVGANVRSARAGAINTPVLARSDAKSEIQIPFEARGSMLSLALDAAGGPLTFGVPLQAAAPAIFVDSEGAPMVLDADNGVLLDPMRPARSNARIQILATGLGAVKPEWTTGLPAPVENPPAVVAPVRALLDRVPVEVTRATLAPGYVGFYLIEIQVPKLVNYGPAELYLEVNGQASNRVRIYVEP